MNYLLPRHSGLDPETILLEGATDEAGRECVAWQFLWEQPAKPVVIVRSLAPQQHINRHSMVHFFAMPPRN